MASADRLIEVFNEAKARPAGAERDLFLSEACRGEPALKEQVLSLLQAHEGAGDFLKHTQLTPLSPLTEKPGDRIGRYKILQQIGEGGCGVVYMAEQEEPVRRRVALKVIKRGMDTKSVIARFEAERQALAMMDHPNIAKVLDAGATDTGRPYFVMELVRGIKITDYCDQHNLSTNERLGLFTQVCQAIQHAHQKGIIHRDIKPSNILVTISEPGSPGCPKVIDFGIAKATTNQRLTDKTVFTAFEQFIGTPAYMSPEQAMMTSLDIDTRTDIYALGVLLYELLTGQTPFDAKDLMAAGLDAMRRIIREQEPARPSTRLSTLLAADLTIVAGHRHAEPGSLGTLLRGDLDWIVMKCLEKDRSRRYETANGLAGDIQRHLVNEPVVACPPSNLYRFQKLVRRNRLAFAAASAVTAALVLGLGVSTWMFFKEKQARQRAVAAEQEQARLRQQAEAEAAESRQIAKYIGDLSQTLGQEGNTAKVESTYRVSLAMWMRLLGKEHQEINDALSSLAQVLQQGKLAEANMTASGAAQKCHSALAQIEKLASERNGLQDCWFIAIGYEVLGQILRESGQPQDVEKVYRDTQILWRKLVADSPNSEDYRWHLAIASDALGQSLKEAGRFDEAAEAYRQALVVWKKLVAEFNKDDPRDHLNRTLSNLASTLQAAGKRTEAELLFREAEPAIREDLAVRQRSGIVNRELGRALSTLARLLRDEGRFDEAQAVQREELAVERKLSGDEHPWVANSLEMLGGELRSSGRLSEAEAVYREGLAMRRKLFGNEHREVAYILWRLGATLLDQGKYAEAEGMFHESLASQRKFLAHGTQLAAAIAELTRTLLIQQKFTEAEPLARECLSIREKKLPDDWLIFSARSLLGGSLLGQNKFAEAEPLLLSAYEGMKQREDKIPANGKARLAESVQRLVQLCEATDQSEKAADWNRKLAEFDKEAK